MKFQRSELEMFCLSTPSKFLKWQRRGISSVLLTMTSWIYVSLSLFFFLSALWLRCADWILASKMCFSMLRLRNQNTIFANTLMLHLKRPVLSACLPSLPYKTQCKSDLLQYIEWPSWNKQHPVSSALDRDLGTKPRSPKSALDSCPSFHEKLHQPQIILWN